MVRGTRKKKPAKAKIAPNAKTSAAIDECIPKHTTLNNNKITSYFPHEPTILEEENDDPRTPKENRSTTVSVLTQTNGNVTKQSPHRIEMKIQEDATVATDSTPKVVKKPRSRNLKVIQPNIQDKTILSQNTLTNYFPVRRSVRKTSKVVLEEIQRSFEEAVLSQKEDGLQIHVFDGKGRGVVATQTFSRGDFVVEYAGELISLEEAKKREMLYARDQNTGCYMYYFSHKNLQYCVDATAETERLGRLINHSRNGNLTTKTVVVKGQPHLVLVAKDTINIGDELCYDYGDRSKESLRHHPWLAL